MTDLDKEQLCNWYFEICNQYFGIRKNITSFKKYPVKPSLGGY